VSEDLAIARHVGPSEASLAALAAEAWRLEPPMPHERKAILRDEAALLVDGLLARVARGRGALDVAIGEVLASLAVGDRVLRLGCSGIGDYARERLGIGASTAKTMARLARELRERPLLGEAVRRGEVSARKAQVVLPVARGEDEAAWVARARSETVRALAAAVEAAGRTGEEGEEEEWERICVPLAPEERAVVDEAMKLAGKLLGATAPKAERLEAICQEFLGAHPDDPSDAGADGGDLADEDGVLRGPVAEWLAAAKETLEEETGRWAALATVEAVVAPEVAVADANGRLDPARLDAQLRELAAMRDRWDEVLGHLALLVRSVGLWRDMGFATFSHYCAERLGMARRAVEQRIALERRLQALPALRAAMRDGRVSYEQARLVAAHADEDSVTGLIARAEATTCIALRRELEAAEEAQMCRRQELDLRVPRRVGDLLIAAFRAARTAADAWLTPGESLARVARHFVDTWGPAFSGRRTRQQKAIERDGRLCQVPGCSRAADHAHHVQYRSHGGSHDLGNLTGLCAVHHLQGVHRGLIRVRGRAPGRLRWELRTGARRPAGSGEAPLVH
jgi:hypothetical protein